MQATNKIYDASLYSTKEKIEVKSDVQRLAENFIANPTDLSFSKLENRIKWGLKGYIFSIVKNSEDTDIVYNMVLEHIYFKRNTYNSEKSTFSTWMYRIAHNVTFNYIRDESKKKCMCVQQDLGDIYDSCINADLCENMYNSLIDIVCIKGNVITMSREMFLSEVMDASIDCISYLPNNLKTVMYDRIINHKTINEIAEDNNIPVSSVKNWVRKGKNELKNELKSKYGHLYDIMFETVQKAV